MNKKQLMTAIAKLEKKLDRAEVDNTSLVLEMDERRGKTEGTICQLSKHEMFATKSEETAFTCCVHLFAGKMALEGTVAQKLNQLDRRVTELLEECAKQRNVIKKLKDDRVFYRKKNEEKE